MLDGGKVGDECTSLERLERLVEDLEYECGVEDMVHILACQCHAERGAPLNTPPSADTEGLPADVLVCLD